MYKYVVDEGVVLRISDGIQVSPVSSETDPLFIEYKTWASIPGNELVYVDTRDPVGKAQAELIQTYTDALTEYFDKIAQQKKYDNRITCSVRAGYPGPFQAEGIAFATWMDTCNAYGYQVIQDVLMGNRTLPSIDDFLIELPGFAWPG